MSKAKRSQKAIDELVRKAAGGGRAIESLIKSCMNRKWTRYQMYGCSDGAVVYVNVDRMEARLMDSGSRSAKQHAKRKAAERKSTKKAAQ
jgi:hypothetical protein